MKPENKITPVDLEQGSIIETHYLETHYCISCDEEPDGYECECCGNIQNTANGFGCNRCSGPMKEWYF